MSGTHRPAANNHLSFMSSLSPSTDLSDLIFWHPPVTSRGRAIQVLWHHLCQLFSTRNLTQSWSSLVKKKVNISFLPLGIHSPAYKSFWWKLITENLHQYALNLACFIGHIPFSGYYFYVVFWDYLEAPNSQTVMWILLPFQSFSYQHNFPDNKIHGANMGPTWVLSAPDGPSVGPMNLAIWVKANLSLCNMRGLSCLVEGKQLCIQRSSKEDLFLMNHHRFILNLYNCILIPMACVHKIIS